jgi:hypothetical protein
MGGLMELLAHRRLQPQAEQEIVRDWPLKIARLWHDHARKPRYAISTQLAST